MKKIHYLLCLVILASLSTKGQYINIPDANFKAFLLQNYPACFNMSGMMDTACSEIVNATTISFGDRPVSNWEGFQYFRNLQVASFYGELQNLPILPGTMKVLQVVGNSSVTTIPVLPGGLRELYIESCYNFQTLPILPNTLLVLDCSDNHNFTNLPALPASLRKLNCYSNHITLLPSLPSALDTLDCSGNDSINVLPSLPATLKYLNCSRNNISSLGASLPSLLTDLIFARNQITSVPALPSHLRNLNGEINLLTALPVLPVTLTTLYMAGNALTTLPSIPPVLKSISVGGNQLTAIPSLPATLISLSCYLNNLVSLPVLPGTITSLDCSYNQLTSLPPLANTAITTMSCRQNSLTTLPALPATLTQLSCEINRLTALPALPVNLQRLTCNDNNISFLPAIPQTLQEIWCQGNNILCLPVLPDGIHLIMDTTINCIPNDVSGYVIEVDFGGGSSIAYNNVNPFPFCSAINNVYHCDAFPLMKGYVYNDNNNNNVKDANEPYRANVRINLSNGAYTLSNSNGYYEILADSIGSYALSSQPPNYFASAPPQFNYLFSSYDTLVNNNFALQATSSVDSVTVSISPVSSAAKPGFPFAYQVRYENSGTTTLTPQIVFNYDNSRMLYDSSSNAAVTNAAGSLQLNEPAMVAGASNSFLAYFHVNTTAPIGDTLFANAHITANAAFGTDSIFTVIRGSYDPNDKFATPSLSPAQLNSGNYIDYTIRFQNTGNDTAFSIVITDTLSSFLQASTLEVINTSHPCKITVKGNVAYFEFINILLPDSNVNELKSHGLVSFRVKPQANLSLNSIVPNKAAIYFDYNSPVITNTAITTIAEPVILPLKLLSFTVSKQGENKALVNWTTANEFNVIGFSIEVSPDGRQYQAIASEAAHNKQYNSYAKAITLPVYDIAYLRLKSTDLDGKFFYSPVIILRKDKTNPAFSFLQNPVKNILKIAAQDDALLNTTARIINTQGSIVLSFYFQHPEENINVSRLPAGIYILETVKGNGQFVLLK